MTNKIALLPYRSLLVISGEERKSFLQGLITNDINKVGPNHLLYAVMLNAQGRFLYDFFIFEKNEKLFLDCDAARRDEILKKLNFYKLRAKVVIAKSDELAVMQVLDGKVNEVLNFADPRSKALGNRAYIQSSSLPNIDEMAVKQYHFQRITNHIPEGEFDLTYEKSFIQEFGFDDLGAIDYNKGCYVGQELTARTHYRGEIRKKIVHLKIPQRNPIEKGCKIFYQGNVVGEILSSVSYHDEIYAMALVKLPDGVEDLMELPLSFS